MSGKNIYSNLSEKFPSASKEKWQQAASQEIDGKDPFVELSWNTVDQISVSPYFDSTDVAQLSYLQNFFSFVDEKSFLGNRAWTNAPRISVNNDFSANKIALDHLSNGADGVFFALHRECELTKLLSAIEWQYCSIFFETDQFDFHTRTLLNFISAQKFSTETPAGALFWQKLPTKQEINIELLKFHNFKSLGIKVSPSTPVRELADALLHAISIIESFDDQVHQIAVINTIAFSLSLQTDFFESIAKCRALRVLWFQVANAYGISEKEFHQLHIHGRSEKWISDKYEPHGNMIKATTSAMAATLGGCDSITIDPQDENNSMMNRVARNVSSVLREESHLDKVANPVDGSYALDVMTNEIAQKAWALFQSDLKK